jgi:excisionase family DNA binding protein
VNDEQLNRIEALLQGLVADAKAEWLPVKGAAEITACHSNTVRRAIASGLLAASNIGSQERPVYRLHRKDIKAWMDGMKSQVRQVASKDQRDARVERFFGKRK